MVWHDRGDGHAEIGSSLSRSTLVRGCATERWGGADRSRRNPAPARSWSDTAYWPQFLNWLHDTQSCAIFSGAPGRPAP
jgi:hypothetical protein